MRLDDLNYPQLERVYALANTPGYLARNFAQDETLRSFARSTTISELRDLLALNTGGATLRDRVRTYVILVALAFQGVGLTGEESDRLAASGIEWAGPVMNSVRPPSASTDVEFFSPGPVLTVVAAGQPPRAVDTTIEVFGKNMGDSR